MSGGITVPISTVYASYESQGLDAKAVALAYVQAWADKVPSGTLTLLAKMKCAMADGPCGCPKGAFIYKCTGPYPQVPIEIILELLFPKDGSSCAVKGVEAKYLLAPEYFVGNGHVHLVEFAGPAYAVYIKKA
jgi:hypothetical protein